MEGKGRSTYGLQQQVIDEVRLHPDKELTKQTVTPSPPSPFPSLRGGEPPGVAAAAPPPLAAACYAHWPWRGICTTCNFTLTVNARGNGLNFLHVPFAQCVMKAQHISQRPIFCHVVVANVRHISAKNLTRCATYIAKVARQTIKTKRNMDCKCRTFFSGHGL